MSLDALLADFLEAFGAGPEPTAANLHAASAGLAASWYRNTEAVEDDLHVGGGVPDHEMLRRNAWVTELCRRAISDLVTEGADPGVRLEALLDEVIATLPPGRARRSLRREKGGAPGLAARWIAPGFVRIVDRYVELGPPDPGTFRDRMARGPWLLSDAQARFVCLHRYDVR